MIFAATQNRRPANTTWIGRTVARRPVAAFLILAYGVGWPTLLAADHIGLPFLLVSSLGVVFGLALPASLATAATGGAAGVRELVGRFLKRRAGVRWYLVALLGLLGATLLAASALPGLSPLGALAEEWPLFFTVFLPRVLVLLVLIQLFEEVGWMGFMQDRLQGRYGPLVASVMVAPAFVLFHLPLAFLEAPRITLTVVQLAGVQFAVQAAVVVFLRVAIAWLYNGSGGSVLIAALFHTSFNTAGTGSEYATGFIRELVPGTAALLIPLAVVAVVATVVAVLTGGRLGYEPGRTVTRPADTEGQWINRGRHEDASEPLDSGAHVQERGDRD